MYENKYYLAQHWYIQYDYRTSKDHSLYTSGYIVISAVNKRHARKILFKVLPKSRKRGLCNIKIESYQFRPYHNIPNLDYGNYEHHINEFWCEQEHEYLPLLKR